MGTLQIWDAPVEGHGIITGAIVHLQAELSSYVLHRWCLPHSSCLKCMARERSISHQEDKDTTAKFIKGGCLQEQLQEQYLWTSLANACKHCISTGIPTDVAAGSVIDDAKASTSMQPTCSSSLPTNEKATTSTPHMNDRKWAAKYILNYR